MKSPSVSENVKIEPATIPGSASGNSTLRNVRQPRRAEVGRGLEEVVRDALERGVHGNDHEREPDVGEDEPHPPVRVQQVDVREPDLVQRPVERAVVAEDRPPGVDPNEVARPEREEDRDQQERPCARLRDARHVVREREGEDRVHERDGGRDPDRAARRS